jgi:hypothetical protein
MTRCSRCHRPLRLMAVTVGTLTIGPKCASLMGIKPEQRMKAEGRYVVVVPGQLPLFEMDRSGHE